MQFTRLFEEGRIGGMKVKNRTVMAPMANRLNDESGAVTQRFIDFYVERAKGGVGLIIVENTCVDWPLGKAGDFPVRLDSDSFIHGFNDLAEAVHPYGAKLATQLQHAGRQTNESATEGLQPVTSSVLTSYRGSMARELTIPEIKAIVEKFADAARRTKQAGFDAVEIHGAHGYLPTQFMSPYMNTRNDMYGGSFENRMRFPLEIVARVREQVGPDFPIIYRFSAFEHVAGGVDLEEGKRIARALQDAGVDAIDVSAGVQACRYWIFPTMAMPRGCNVETAAGVREVVDIPVIVVGRINDPILAEQILEDGKADFIALGRPLVADPYFVEKTSQGRVGDIRPCIACNECILRLMRHWRIGCSVNPDAGYERENELKPAQKPKNVLIAGGGPAGMEAARVAALRGHKVTLCEKGSELGGQLLLASVPSFKKEIAGYVQYLSGQLEKLNVTVELGKEVTAELVKQRRPDAVVVATGAVPLMPEIPGADGKTVVTAEAVLAGGAKVGKTVVVAGGGRLGVEMAYHLSQQGVRVTLVEMTGEVGADLELSEKMYFLERLKEAGVEMLTHHKIQALTEEGAQTVDRNWQERLIPADTVVLALGACSEQGLLKALEGLGVETYAVGDCVEPRNIYAAVHEAARVARWL
ncbi:MAG TPA: FAD-dependent oxidoreductase [Chloroflexi bacterium]|nr:FAD-dependent oxidoreductase [Chloroflexota bacterium]